MLNPDLMALLEALPVNVPVSFMQEQLCLTMATDGATLSADIALESSAQMMESALALGFSWALEFDAGLASDADGRRLFLLQWLPGVEGWVSATAALEKLIDQLESCRLELADGRGKNQREKGHRADQVAQPDPLRSRDEQRFRRALLR